MSRAAVLRGLRDALGGADPSPEIIVALDDFIETWVGPLAARTEPPVWGDERDPYRLTCPKYKALENLMLGVPARDPTPGVPTWQNALRRMLRKAYRKCARRIWRPARLAARRAIREEARSARSRWGHSGDPAAGERIEAGLQRKAAAEKTRKAAATKVQDAARAAARLTRAERETAKHTQARAQAQLRALMGIPAPGDNVLKLALAEASHLKASNGWIDRPALARMAGISLAKASQFGQ